MDHQLRSLFHAGAFVSDGILAASSRVALAKVDLRSRELINRSVLPHKHLDGLRSVLFVHPMPDFATSTLRLSSITGLSFLALPDNLLPEHRLQLEAELFLP